MNATFNPGLIDVTNLSAAQVRRLGHADDIDHQPRRHPMAAVLLEAAKRWDQRRDAFATGKADICRDMAAKLDRFGSFVSDKQEQFARKLVEWSQPRGQQPAQTAPGAPIAGPAAPSPAPTPVVRLERLFALMQRLSKLTIGKLTIARKNGDSLCWVKHADFSQVVGKIDGGVLTLFKARLTVGADIGLTQDLLRIEADPEAAAVLHGKASGRCSVCSRDLTDPASIERGIGPICAEKFLA